MHDARDLAVLDHEENAEVAVDLDSTTRPTRRRPGTLRAEERQLRLTRDRTRPVEVLPALECEERLLGEVVGLVGDIAAVEVSERGRRSWTPRVEYT